MVEWSHKMRVIRAIPIDDIDTVKIWTWLLILFLRYHGPKIHTERRNNNNNNNNNDEEKNKIRTNSIGDMPLYGISPNNTLASHHKTQLSMKLFDNFSDSISTVDNHMLW